MPLAPPLVEALRDRYVLERELGHGGMATVYLARDLKHDRLVAVKVLRPDLAAVLGGERFLREIRLTAQLQHPHILSLLDSGEASGFLFYVMPYVEGESLRHRLTQEGQLPLEETLRITRGVAAALDYAHQRGVIHRDIKPENILLYQGEPMVADFGVALAAATAGRERLTETGLSLGTPAYMSPEQASASPRLDARSDQYSLACVVYEMLAGEPPYTGPTAQAIIAKRFSEPVPHLSTVRSVPAALEAAVAQALSRSPADRFPSTMAFAEALERLKPPRRFNRRMAALAGGLAVLLGVGVVAFLLRPREPAGPVVSRQFTFTGRANEPAISPDGGSVAYVSTNQSLVVQRLDGSEPVVLVPPSRWLFSPRWTGDGSAILFCYMSDSSRLAATWMVASTGGSAREVIHDIDAFDAGPDSTTALLAQREIHQIQLVDLPTGKVRKFWRTPDSLADIQQLDWSPDRHLVALEADGIWLMSTEGGELRRLSRTGSQPRWSPAGDAVYYLDGPRGTTTLEMIRLDRRGEPRGPAVQKLGLPTTDQFAVGQNGVLVHNQVAISSQAAAISYSAGLPRTIIGMRTLTEGTGSIHSLAISEDGKWVAVSRNQGENTSLVIFPFEGGAGQKFAGSAAKETGPSWSPDGRRLAFVRWDSGGSRLMVAAYPEGQAQRLGSAESLRGFTAATWSADAKWLTYWAADLKRIGLINLERQQETFLRAPDSIGSGYGTAFSGGALISPDARHIVISTIHHWNDWGELWLAATDDGRILRRIPEPFGESYPLRWTEDGWLYILNNRALYSDNGEFRLQLWRMSTSRWKPEFYADVPEGCRSLSIAGDGRRAACSYNTRQSDLVLAAGFTD